MPNIRAGVAWYGRTTGEKSANFPNHPIDLATKLKAPVLGLYGAKDAGISVATVAATMTAFFPMPVLALSTQKTNIAAKQSQFVLYSSAGHAFHADYRATYVPSAAKDGWEKAIAWFKEKGV